jgi:type I restriction enzyme, S subunit
VMAEEYTKPESWLELNLSDVVRKISTNKKKVKQKEYIDIGPLPVIDQGSQYIGGYTNDLSKKIDCELPVIIFGDHTKVIKYINFEFAPGADGVKVIRPINCYDSKLFLFFLKVLVNKIPDKGYARHFQHLEKTKIPLPPLPEQHQIVSKIEELFSELDNGVESLKKTRQQLKTYRQAVLKYAFEGKLTREWREQQIESGNLPEPAEMLLELIKKEREEHYQKQVEEWNKACEQAEKDGSKKPAKPRKPKDLPPLTEKELAELPELPEGWGWIRAGELFSYVTSGSRGWAKYYSTDGAIFIRIANLDFDSLKIDLNDNNIQHVVPPANSEGTRTKIKAGDFLFSITGYLGMFAIAPKLSNSAYINQHIALARPLDCFEKKYIGYYCISKTGGFYHLNKNQKGATKAGLTLDDIRLFSVPICSISEQARIISEIETRLSVCDKLEQTIEDSLKKAEALRQSILKKAFEGELTREWRLAHPELISGENSAENLLARIWAEKESLRKNSPQRLKGRRGKSNK